MKFAIMGTGVMGQGWITQCAMSGHEVHAHDASAQTLAKATDACVKLAGKAAKKLKIDDPEFGAKAKANIHTHEKLADFIAAAKQCDVFFEVIFEDMDLKCRVLREVMPQLPESVYFWSNTSSLDINVLGEASGRPAKAIVAHGMNPVPLMVGVELVPGSKTAPETVEHCRKTLADMGKNPFVAPNIPGFWVNHLLVPQMLDAMRLVESGRITVGDGDVGLNTSLGHPQGTFKLADFVSAPTMLRVALEMYQTSTDPRFYPPAILMRMVKNGDWGVSKGKGFYDWSDMRNPQPRDMSEYHIKSADDLTDLLK
jgi:3-hydroxybutyryl-CoA dehydrogenase